RAGVRASLEVYGDRISTAFPGGDRRGPTDDRTSWPSALVRGGGGFSAAPPWRYDRGVLCLCRRVQLAPLASRRKGASYAGEDLGACAASKRGSPFSLDHGPRASTLGSRSEEHTSELQSR